MDPNAREPRTPTSTKKPFDPQRTPTTPLLPLPALFPFSLSRTGTRPRRNSWEDEMPPVVALPDPRAEDELAFCEIWTGALAQTSKDAQAHFFALLKAEFGDRPADHERLLAAFRTKDRSGRTNIGRVLDVTSLLFAGHGELARAFNHCLGPGYGIEAADEYVTVFTPVGGWKQYPDGRRVYHGKMGLY
ncbi:hypothetical protein GSI_10916 [Ganoderma sinense ZZ0214-1]|uniref:Uncharacterized protein n=1 Tax=Ganoderma sinense ZZ0214-1 TaxID=1077348 RepID=A0A2G8S1W1_9APHY|nr:hypothetical protein GSI_10916 [Ganoderma sinense ZZ0214-1]